MWSFLCASSSSSSFGGNASPSCFHQSRERKTFRLRVRRPGWGRKRRREKENIPEESADVTDEDAETSANGGFRVDTFNLDETFQRRVSWKELDASSFFPPPPPILMLDDDTNASGATSSSSLEEEKRTVKN